jgi:GGDEF domain-containing protein
MKKSNKDIEIEILQKRIKELERKLETYSVDPSYEVFTRSAIFDKLEAVRGQARYIVFLDIDNLHHLNATTPGHHEAVNQKIRRALHIRAEDVLFPARWYSGDELIIVLSGEPSSFCARLLEAFAREGMSFTCSWVEYTGDLEGDAARAKENVDKLKAARGIGR